MSMTPSTLAPQRFEFASRLLPSVLLVTAAAGLVLLVVTLVQEGVSRQFLYLLGGTCLTAIFAARESRGFFWLDLTPGRIRLQFLFRSVSILRGDVARVELKPDGPTLLDHLVILLRTQSSGRSSYYGRKRSLEREEDQLEAASKWRAEIARRGGARFVSARFANRDLFLPLRAIIPR
jgi:hypothetical protein